jgi:hypothetical protein
MGLLERVLEVQERLKQGQAGNAPLIDRLQTADANLKKKN